MIVTSAMAKLVKTNTAQVTTHDFFISGSLFDTT
jgi:hypothetical protein